jgi:hypothetical protein
MAKLWNMWGQLFHVTGMDRHRQLSYSVMMALAE